MAVYQDKKTGKWKADVWFHGTRIHVKSFTSQAFAKQDERNTITKAEKLYLTGSQALDYEYNELFKLWMTDASLRKRSTSLTKDNQMNRDYVEPFIGHLKISQISVKNFQQILLNMKSEELSESSMNKVIQHFKAVFNYSFNNDLIFRNPARNIKQFKIPQKDMDFYSKEEVEIILRHTDKKYIGEERWKHVFYLCLFLTGARLGEILGLEWHKISDNGWIRINQQWCYKEKKLIDTTKSKKNRNVPMNDVLKKELAILRNTSKSSFIFASASGNPIDQSNLRNRIWLKNIKETSVRYIRLHDGRHTYGSHFVMNAGLLYDLSGILGHANIKTTERYSHLSPEHQLKNNNRVNFDYRPIEDNILCVSQVRDQKESSLSDHNSNCNEAKNHENVMVSI